ncbi:MAG: hypothetical protein ABJE10_16845 [bacterium]
MVISAAKLTGAEPAVREHYALPFTEEEFRDAFAKFMDRDEAEQFARDIVSENVAGRVQDVFGITLTEDTLVALASLSPDCAARVEQFRLKGIAMRDSRFRG